jgi:Arc/MetJ-type ribon-helix-helix transcriptional regulator
MPHAFNPRVQQMLDDQMRRGGYSSVDDLLIAALSALDEATSKEDFAPGELDALLAEGDADIERGEVIDGERR